MHRAGQLRLCLLFAGALFAKADDVKRVITSSPGVARDDGMIVAKTISDEGEAVHVVDLSKDQISKFGVSRNSMEPVLVASGIVVCGSDGTVVLFSLKGEKLAEDTAPKRHYLTAVRGDSDLVFALAAEMNDTKTKFVVTLYGIRVRNGRLEIKKGQEVEAAGKLVVKGESLWFMHKTAATQLNVSDFGITAQSH